MVTEMEKHKEQNTKRQIKDIIIKMRAQLTRMEEKNLIEWLENQNEEPISSVKEQNIIKDNQKCPSCQRKVAQALTELGECDNFATWTKKSEKTWEENIFTNTEIVVGNPLATKDEIVKVVLVGTSEANMDRGVQKIYRDRYPELEHIKEDFGMLEQDFRIRTKTTNTTKTRKIIKLTHNETEEDLYNKISDLKTELVTEEGVILHKVECVQQTRFRKMVEAIFHGTSTTAYIYTNKKVDTASEKPRRQGRDSYALVVENAGKTFSESLTEIKAILKTNNAEKGIRGIRSTREGKLLITTEKDKQTVSKIYKALETMDNNGNNKIRKLGGELNRETIHIRGLDAVTEKREVEEALRTIIPELDNLDYKLGDLRPIRGSLGENPFSTPAKRKLGDMSITSESADDTHKKKLGNTTTRTESAEDKRKENPEYVLLTEAISRIDALSLELENNIEQNTKRRIKELAVALKKQMKILKKTQITSWLNEHRYTREFGTQTDFGEIPKLIELEEIKTKKEIFTILESGGGFQELAPKLDSPWPEDIYKITAIEAGNPINAHTDYDIVIMANPEEGCDTGLLKQVKHRFPELAELMLEDSKDIEYIVNTSRRSRQTATLERFLYAIPQKEIVPEIIFKKTQRLMELTTRAKRKKLLIATDGGINTAYLRKMIEFLYRKEEVEWRILTPKEVRKNTLERQTSNRPRSQYDTVIINSQGKSYVDTLKEIKKTVEIGKLGITVSSLKKLGDSSVCLKIARREEEKNDANRLMNAVQSAMKDTSVKVKTNEDVYYIMGLDGASSGEEVIQAVLGETGIERQHITLKALKMDKNDNQIATIGIRMESKHNIPSMGKIKIGWTTCTIKQRVYLARCHKCLEFGHKTTDCKGVNRARQCLNCGANDHQAKECKGEPTCFACSAKRHRTDNTGCPTYRKLLESHRRELTKRGTS
ncbi:unnamed protein product [Ceutorhynchus assimilis]|uniref:CCHC-type domain-containing protein n=1 Tax=Ceutorhynchus assimilis TaxID=467358 RepID=A0A9N9MF80_9CUCU|nr:unnamed protein product [Ceutorhynchus assimilis]